MPANPDDPVLELWRVKAEAKALLQDPSKPPFIVCEWTARDRDADGGQTGAWHEPIKAVTCVAGIDREFLRAPGESVPAFIERVARTLPAAAEFPACIFLFPDETPCPSLVQ